MFASPCTAKASTGKKLAQKAETEMQYINREFSTRTPQKVGAPALSVMICSRKYLAECLHRSSSADLRSSGAGNSGKNWRIMPDQGLMSRYEKNGSSLSGSRNLRKAYPAGNAWQKQGSA